MLMGMPASYYGIIRMMNNIRSLYPLKVERVERAYLASMITKNLTFNNLNITHDYSLLISRGLSFSIIPRSA